MKKLIGLVALVVALAAAPFAQAQAGGKDFGYAFAQDYGAWSAQIDSNVASGAVTVTIRGKASFSTPGGKPYFPFLAGNVVHIGEGTAEDVTITSAADACADQNALLNSCTFVATLANSHRAGARLSSGTYGLREAILNAGASDVTVIVSANSPITSTMITNATHPFTQTTMIKQLNGGNEIWYSESGANFAATFDVGGDGSLTFNPDITSTTPRITLTETGAGSNLTLWDLNLDAAVLDLRTRTDADGAGATVLEVKRGTTTTVKGISFGAAVPTNPQAFLAIVPPAFSQVTANQSYSLLTVSPGGATTIPAGTAPVVASARFDEPNLTCTGTCTAAATVYISGAPTEGTSNDALLIGSGSLTTAGRIKMAKGADIASGGGSCVSGDCTLGNDGNVFLISGTTTVDGFATAGWQAGSIVWIQTSGNITFNSAGTVAGGYAAMALTGNLSMTANDTIGLLYDGTSWVEIALIQR